MGILVYMLRADVYTNFFHFFFHWISVVTPSNFLVQSVLIVFPQTLGSVCKQANLFFLRCKFMEGLGDRYSENRIISKFYWPSDEENSRMIRNIHPFRQFTESSLCINNEPNLTLDFQSIHNNYNFTINTSQYSITRLHPLPFLKKDLVQDKF